MIMPNQTNKIIEQIDKEKLYLFRAIHQILNQENKFPQLNNSNQLFVY